MPEHASESASASPAESSAIARDFDVVIVGGGAAGIMAALEARAQGASVAVLEKNERLGKKILISGGGKCNITNLSVELENYHGTHPRFAQDVLRSFDQYDTMDWIEGLGVPIVTQESNGKVWPEAMTSKAVLIALEKALEEAGVEVFTTRAVSDAKRSEQGFVVTTRTNERFTSRALILATGGKAAPHLGADGSGLALAESFGHALVDQFPALVGLTIKEEWVHELSGLTLEDVEITLDDGGKGSGTLVHGSLLFTHWGVTSPAIFRLSREVEPALAEGKQLKLKINYRPDAFGSFEHAQQLLFQALGENTKKRAGTVLGYIVGYRRLGDALVSVAGGDPDKRVRELQKRERDHLEELIYRCPLTITGTLGFKRAETMRGGVDVRKVDPRSMASKLADGLFICGEMLDIDADVGGYSFQFAFASGKAAGSAAAAIALA